LSVTVTGAAGHLGANLVRELLAGGHRVRALVHENQEPLAGLEVEQVRGDVRDPQSLGRAFAGTDVVYHLAGVISIDGDRDGLVREVNVDGAATVAKAALVAGVRRMVHVSSIHAFRMTPLDRALDETRARVEDKPGEHAAYDRSKAEGERRVRLVVEQGLDCVIVHPSGVIGPLDFAPSRMGRVFLDLYHQNMPALIDGGLDFVDVRDVTQGMIAAAKRGRTNESYLLSGHWTSVRELADMAESVTGVPAPRFTTPMWLARMAAPWATAVGRIRGSEPLFTSESLGALWRSNRTIVRTKARKELGYAPRPLSQTVRDLYAWFESVGRIAPRR
jgi:dihydroflavonol-4-reductase